VSPKAVRLIYLAGDARSGSTILAALLGAAPGVVASGELNMLLDAIGGARMCACGRPVSECSLWATVLERFRSELAPSGTDDYLALQERFTRIRAVPRLLLAARRRSPSFGRYSRWTAKLLEAIAAAAGAAIVADSAKNPVRALAILLGGQVDVRLVHLVRDPRGVAWSKRKASRRSGWRQWRRHGLVIAARAALDWVVSNLATEAILASHPALPAIRIRYEDLAGDPEAALRQIGRVVGIDLAPIGRMAARGEVFPFGHIMAGNAARERGPSRIAIDMDWETNSPRWMRRTVWLAAGWLARRYGYR